MSVLKSPLAQNLKIALIQLKASADKAANLAKVARYIDTAVAESKIGKLDVVMLPECFNSPYAVDKFREYAEQIPGGETTTFLADLARKHGLFIVGGSIPEQVTSTDQIFNTSLTFDPLGAIVAVHRKAHLFDIDIPNGITFKESLTLSAGDKATVFKMGDFGNVGLGICYDIRFPELAMGASRAPNNAFAMFYPGAFNTTTGPLHWHLLARARAVDNEVFTVLCSPARDVGGSGYQAYGHSLVVDPSGRIVAEAGEGEEVLYAELDKELLPAARSGIPVHYQRRYDIYDDVTKSLKVSDK
ncbi:carbon-nitrogen hydrolase [Metschnikowia bicuspidata var. bicuspidata NRRL YB-4993]|uniref:Carbon-nitrogen hydrolase n=1 Tax=Metschnikowia bicuspidata var. bicuspidata NRRL YB-4993 TaxID=869754 RepID=A0A1A0HCR2_9ASCO|nr:carbon-nitrogen hydrolase [Metschnikowia bicuspidata var. bicuspidata NRRL YB-4993]OBA21884.1 carbon-nitrogen hydrolase [Metschnikowia bicuspidata var. bicuspidata NRRL YB-4993]